MIALYVKTHRKTGLKYLGKTVEDPYTYQGSGIHWTNHINKHGYDCDTEVIRWCKDNESVKAWGIFYSDLWNVVESDDWANLKREEGDGGWGYINNDKELKLAKNQRAREKTNSILEAKYGPEWRTFIAKHAHKMCKENKTGIYAEDYVSVWSKNSELQQLGNTPEARSKAVITQKKTFAEICHQQGEKNSQYGTRWITNDKFNMKLSVKCQMPYGWRASRIMGLPSIPKELKELLIAEME